jgi:hypothetical protein
MTAPWPRGPVNRIERGLWTVKSRSEPDTNRIVTWQKPTGEPSFFTCTCMAGRQRGEMGRGGVRPCYHVNAVAQAERADGEPPRPRPPANLGGLVD